MSITVMIESPQPELYLRIGQGIVCSINGHDFEMAEAFDAETSTDGNLVLRVRKVDAQVQPYGEVTEISLDHIHTIVIY